MSKWSRSFLVGFCLIAAASAGGANLGVGTTQEVGPAGPKPAAPQSRDAWLTDFSAAQQEALASKRRLLVLFTGSDWCPPCIEFEAKVAHAPDFLKTATGAFVLVKLDYPEKIPQAVAERVRNEELKERYAVASYPSLLVISADGSKSSRVDARRPGRAEDFLRYYVQVVDEARRAKEKSSFWPW